MSMKHFQFFSHFTEFDIRETPKQRWKHDKFACVRHIFDVNCKFGKGRNPSPFQEILEMLYPYGGHISFKQYNT